MRRSLRVADLLWADVPLPAALRSLGLDPPPLGVAMVAQSGRTAIERMCRPFGDAVVAQSGRTAAGTIIAIGSGHTAIAIAGARWYRTCQDSQL